MTLIKGWIWTRLKFFDVDGCHRFWNGDFPLFWDPHDLGAFYEWQVPSRQPFQNWIHYFVSVPVLTSTSTSQWFPFPLLVSDITQHPDIQARYSLVHHHSVTSTWSVTKPYEFLYLNILNSKLCTSLKSPHFLKAFIISWLFSIVSSFSCF